MWFIIVFSTKLMSTREVLIEDQYVLYQYVKCCPLLIVVNVV